MHCSKEEGGASCHLVLNRQLLVTIIQFLKQKLKNTDRKTFLHHTMIKCKYLHFKLVYIQCKVITVHKIELLPIEVSGTHPSYLLAYTLTLYIHLYLFMLPHALCTSSCLLYLLRPTSTLPISLHPSYLLIPLSCHLFIVHFMSISCLTCTLSPIY